MSNEIALTLNQIHRKTWYWLRLNDIKLTVDTDLSPAVFKPKMSDKVTLSPDGFDIETVGGCGPQFNDLLKEAALTPSVFTTSGQSQRVRLTYDLTTNEKTQAGQVGLVLAENAEMTAVMDYVTPQEKEGTALIQTQVDLKAGSHLTLVQIHRENDQFRVINDVKGQVGDRALLTLIQVVISGKQNIIGVQVELAGYKSRLDIKNGYQVLGDHLLDMNYYIPQTGRRTNSNIVLNGVLRDKAVKNFRGTIDFLKGSSASKGAERENVLLIDDGVVNKSLPVILCHEEDVEGAHGASIGKIDNATLFYLESRGLSEQEVYEMLAKSHLLSVISQIPDPAVKGEIKDYIERTEE